MLIGTLNRTENKCRACLNMDAEMFLIFEHKYNNEEVPALISECTKYKVDRSDKLSRFICQACLKSLYSAVMFKRKFEESQKRLSFKYKQNNKNSFTSIEKFTQTDDTVECPCKQHQDKLTNAKAIEFNNINLKENALKLFRHGYKSNKRVSLSNVDIEDFQKFDKTNEIEMQSLNMDKYAREHNEDKEITITNQKTTQRNDFVEELFDVTGYNCKINKHEEEMDVILNRNYDESKHDPMQLQNKYVSGNSSNQFMSSGSDDSLQIHNPGNNCAANIHKKPVLEIRHDDESTCQKRSFNFPDTNLIKCEQNPDSSKYDNCTSNSTHQTKFSPHFEREQSDKVHKCERCFKQFKTKIYLKKHMTRHCSKRLKCKECEEYFETKFELQRHTKSEGHDKPLLCPECGLRCKTNNTLLVHVRRHKGEKPFKCKYCKKGFPRMDDLRVHEKYHTGEKSHFCEICGKGFQRKYNLTIHLRVHTGEKPYKCPYCNHGFAQGNDLKSHIRRHTGERFRCELCDAAFLQGYQIRHHKLMEHGIKEAAATQRVVKYTSAEKQEQQIKEALAGEKRHLNAIFEKNT